MFALHTHCCIGTHNSYGCLLRLPGKVVNEPRIPFSNEKVGQRQTMNFLIIIFFICFRNPTVVRKVTVTSWSMWVTRMSLQGHPWPSMETTETAQVVEDHLEANADLHLIWVLPLAQPHQLKTKKKEVQMAAAQRASLERPPVAASPLRPMDSLQFPDKPMESLPPLEFQGTHRGFPWDLVPQEVNCR